MSASARKTAHVMRAHERARRAATAATEARFGLARALADAQADGASVRELAELLDLQPTTVQRLIAAAKENA